MPPTTTGTSSRPSVAHALHHLLDQRDMAARQDRQPDDVHALLDGRAHDLRGRQADALVDDLHAAIAGAHGDLLGAVGMAVEARLADQELDAAGRACAETRSTSAADLVEIAAPSRWAAACATPVGARYSPNTSRSVRPTRPSSRRPCAARDRRLHDVAAFLAAARSSSASAAVDGLGVAAGAPGLRAARSARPPPRGSTTSMAPSPADSGEGSVSVQRLTPTTICSPRLDAAQARGVALDQPRFM